MIKDIDAQSSDGRASPASGGLWRPSNSLAFICGALLAFDNLPFLYGITGLYLAGPALPVLFYMLFRSRVAASDRVVWRRYILAVGLLAAWSAATVMISLLSAADVSSGVDPSSKAVTTSIIVFTWLLAARLGFAFTSIPEVLLWIGIGLLSISIIGGAVQIAGIYSSGATDVFHAITWHNDRPRAFKYESSSFGASLLAGIALVAFGLRSRWRTLVILILAILILSQASTSRGTLISAWIGIAIGLGAMLFIRSRLGRFLIPVLLASLLVSFSFFGSFWVQTPWWRRLSAGGSGSDAIRTGWGQVAETSLADSLMGMNVYTYWGQVRGYIADTIPILANDYSTQDLQEFIQILGTSGDSGVSPKTLPALLSVWYGLPGALFSIAILTLAMVGSLRQARLGAPLSAIPVCSVCFGLALYVPGIFQYELAIVLGVALAGLSRNTQFSGASPQLTDWRRGPTNIAGVRARGAETGIRI